MLAQCENHCFTGLDQGFLAQLTLAVGGINSIVGVHVLSFPEFVLLPNIFVITNTALTLAWLLGQQLLGNIMYIYFHKIFSRLFKPIIHVIPHVLVNLWF